MNIKAWWSGLLDRERQMLTVAGVVVGIYLVYSLIWSPLSDAVTDRKTQVQSQQTLLQYMQHASTVIQQYKASGMTVGDMTTASNLLSVVEESASTQDLSSYIKQVAQPQPNQIELTIEAVPLDKLMQWVQTLSTHGVGVSQFSATRLPTIGTANVKMILSVSK